MNKLEQVLEQTQQELNAANPECEKHSSQWDCYDWECHCPGDITFEQVKQALKANQEGRR